MISVCGCGVWLWLCCLRCGLNFVLVVGYFVLVGLADLVGFGCCLVWLGCRLLVHACGFAWCACRFGFVWILFALVGLI